MKRNWQEVTASEQHISKEKAKAREIKSSNWWKQKLSEGICHYCGKHIERKRWSIDHKTPKVRGGSNAYSNLVGACKDCNNNKGRMTKSRSNFQQKILSVGTIFRPMSILTPPPCNIALHLL